MPFIGNQPADKFLTLEKQVFTTSATDTYTLDREVSSVNDIELFLNNVRQEPTEAYTISGTTLTLASAITASDSLYCIYQGRAVGTQSPATGSVTNAMLQNSSITLNGSAVSLGGSATVGGNNTPYFFGQKASDQTISRRSQTVITGFTTNELDSNSAFDGTTFTVPSGEGGLYYFYANIYTDYSSIGADGEWTQIKFRKNNSTSGMPETTVQRPNDGLYNLLTVNQSIIQNLSAGDTMEITAYTSDFNASGSATVSGTQSFFMGYKLIGA
jgi:hypothetical protein